MKKEEISEKFNIKKQSLHLRTLIKSKRHHCLDLIDGLIHIPTQRLFLENGDIIKPHQADIIYHGLFIHRLLPNNRVGDKIIRGLYIGPYMIGEEIPYTREAGVTKCGIIQGFSKCPIRSDDLLVWLKHEPKRPFWLSSIQELKNVLFSR